MHWNCGVLVGFLSIALVALPCAAETGQDSNNGLKTSPNQSQGTESKLLRDVFQAQFSSDTLAQFGNQPTLEALAGRVSEEQRSNARVQLQERQALARTPSELEQIAHGYLLLGEPQSALAIANGLREQSKDNPQPDFLAAQAYLKLGDIEKAAESAKAAHDKDKQNEAIFALLKLTENRVNASKVRKPKDPFSDKAPESSEHGDTGTLRHAASVASADDETKPIKPVLKGTLKNNAVPMHSVQQDISDKTKDSPLPNGMPLWPLAALGGLGVAAYGVQQSRRTWGEQESTPPPDEGPNSERIQRNLHRLVVGAASLAIGFGVVYVGPWVVGVAGPALLSTIRNAAAPALRFMQSEAGAINPNGVTGTSERVREILLPAGERIGKAGFKTDIRTIAGTTADAEAFFLRLSQGAKISSHPRLGPAGKLAELPGNAGTIGFRTVSKSGPPTIDVNVPGINIREIKFTSP